MKLIGPLCAGTAVLLTGWILRPPPARVAELVLGTPARPGARHPRSRPRQRVPPWVGNLRAPAAALAVAVAAFAVAGPLGAFVTVVVVVLRPRLRNIAVRRTHARELAASMPTFVDLLVLAIRSGYSPPLALAAVEPVVPGPLQPAVAEVVRRLALGERFADAVGALPSLVGPEAQPLTDALVTASRYGHPLGPVLDRLATEARMARRQQAEAAVKQLPIRLAFPLAMCILPGFALLSVVPLLGGTLSSLRLTS